MNKLAGKRVVITGSSRGLGKQFALACARQGARLIVNGTQADTVAEVLEEIRDMGAEVASVIGSVAEEAIAQELVQRCVSQYGGIDLLVNNAGIVRDRTLLKMTAAEFDEVIAVDLRGPFLCAREAARAMAGQEHGGHIIQITSGSGFVGNFGQTNYAAAKAGMMGMMYTVVKELAQKSVRCNAIWPVAHTEMIQPLLDREGKTAADFGLGKPEDIAHVLVWLASAAAADWNGQCIAFDGRRLAIWQAPQEAAFHRQDDTYAYEDLNAWLSARAPLPLKNL